MAAGVDGNRCAWLAGVCVEVCVRQIWWAVSCVVWFFPLSHIPVPSLSLCTLSSIWDGDRNVMVTVEM